MVAEKDSSIGHRAAVHRALGDETRLAIVDALWTGDHTPAQLRDITGLESNLLAFHLDALERAGLISRHGSQGDGRRRYVTLAPAALPHVGLLAPLVADNVLFVCTHNAARSQLAAALGGSAPTAMPSAPAHIRRTACTRTPSRSRPSMAWTCPTRGRGTSPT